MISRQIKPTVVVVVVVLISFATVVARHGCTFQPVHAFQSTSVRIQTGSFIPNSRRIRSSSIPSFQVPFATLKDDDGVDTTSNDAANDSAQALLDRAEQLRREIAQMEGKTLQQVQDEAQTKKQQEQTRLEAASEETEERQRQRRKNNEERNANTGADDGGRYLQIPSTFDEMTRQAAKAVETASRDGCFRQVVRFNLVSEDQTPTEENEWPGGARQMYRQSGKPLTDGLLRDILQLRKLKASTNTAGTTGGGTIQQQDLWDFDGSALHTVESTDGPKHDIQAVVFPNTDVKYLNDIDEISQSMGPQRLVLLVNPFWRNVDSWGFNLLAPGAKRRAQDVIFGGGPIGGGGSTENQEEPEPTEVDESSTTTGFKETYSLQVFQCRGELCCALKVYPYSEYQLFAFREDDDFAYGYGGGQDYTIRLGSTKDEPTSAMITKLLNDRPEFKDTKTMRQMKKNIRG